MHADADLARRLLPAAVLRRMPLWLAGALPWLLLALGGPRIAFLGLMAWVAFVAVDFLRLRARVTREWARWLDGAMPELEDSSALLAVAESPIATLQRQRLLTRVDAALTGARMRAIASARVPLALYWALPSFVLAGALWAWQGPRTAVQPAAVAKAAAAAIRGDVTLHIAPPAYTGVAPFESAPHDLQVPEHSLVKWCMQRPGADEAIELSDGGALMVGAACAQWTATESMFWRWRGVRYNLRVLPDQPPQITVSAPTEMIQVLVADAKDATITVSVRDDYRVRRASLHMTLARGSGENIRFSDREVPLPESADPRVRTASRAWSLKELGMEPGDELYFFVRALDNAEPPHLSQSPTYTLRLPGPVVEETQSSALPMLVKPETLRSQRQIIIDTEQLVADMKANPALGAGTVRSRSEAIANEQAQLRRRYGQFLGEESSLFGGDDHDHEDHGAKRDLQAEYGHVHDQPESATLFDESTKKVLRRALTAMWDAEKSLRALTPKPALPPEYKALEAVKELQQADRIYLHKTAFVPPAIKEEKRMTGDVVGAAPYRRVQAAADEAVPLEVRELLEALSADGALPALWTRSAQEWIRARIAGDEQRLAAQRALQDVADGCVKCRPVLRAWLRGGISEAPVMLQARPVVDTPFERAWRAGAKP
jgi:hypothetical protein